MVFGKIDNALDIEQSASLASRSDPNFNSANLRFRYSRPKFNSSYCSSVGWNQQNIPKLLEKELWVKVLDCVLLDCCRLLLYYRSHPATMPEAV